MSRRIFCFILTLGMLISACACSLSPRLFETATPDPGSSSDLRGTASAQTPLESIFAEQGDLIRDGDIRLMVHGWMEMGPTLSKEPDPGNKYIAVDFSVVNVGSSLMELFGMHGNWFVGDSDGNTFGPADYYDMMNRDLVMSGMIYPGEKIHETIIYQVRETSAPYTFHYTNDRLRGLAPITVALSERPSISDPPDNIEGEIAPTVEPMDQLVTRGNWQIQVLDVNVSQPCKQERRSSLNCSAFPNDILDVRVDLAQKNTSSQSHSVFIEGMFWLQDPSGRRFFGDSDEISMMGASVESGKEIRFSADFLVWPNTSVLWLAFRYHYGEDSASEDYVCIVLPLIAAP